MVMNNSAEIIDVIALIIHLATDRDRAAAGNENRRWRQDAEAGKANAVVRERSRGEKRKREGYERTVDVQMIAEVFPWKNSGYLKFIIRRMSHHSTFSFCGKPLIAP
jgi:hypothetical protein